MNRRRISKARKRSRESQSSSQSLKRRRTSQFHRMSSSDVEEVPVTPSSRKPPANSIGKRTVAEEGGVDKNTSDLREVLSNRRRSEERPRELENGYISSEVEEVPVTVVKSRQQPSEHRGEQSASSVEEVSVTRFVAGKPPQQSSARLLATNPQRVSGVDLKAAQEITQRILSRKDVIPTYYYMPDLNESPKLVRRFLYKDGFSCLHPAIDPASRGQNEIGKQYGVPPMRAARKREQIANLVAAVAALQIIHSARKRRRKSSDRWRILDMCGGCGHVGLTLAALFPDWEVVVIDTREFALDVARRRAHEANLRNLKTLRNNIEDLNDLNFDIAVALHACGGASDTVLAKAAERQASVVVASCCTGGIVSTKGSVTGSASGAEVVDPASKSGTFIDWSSPRSVVFREILRTGEYSRLARAADFGEKLDDKDNWRRVAKSLLEHDRALWMMEVGYDVRILKMKPLSCSPKNDILMAWAISNEESQTRIEQAILWDADEDSNQFLRDVRDGNVIKTLGDSEVSTVERILNTEVCAESSAGKYTFPKGTGKRMRKVIHAVADSMGLWHGSEGKGSERRVTVQRTEYWPLFCDRFIGVGGIAIEELSKALAKKIPSDCVKRRALLRGNPHHITIITPPEMGKLPHWARSDIDRLLRIAMTKLKNTEVKVCGIGKVTKELNMGHHPASDNVEVGASIPGGEAGSCSGASQANEVYFIVLEWPEANAFRREYGLSDTDFHVTLGFTVKDIHGLRKDRSTVISKHEQVLTVW